MNIHYIAGPKDYPAELQIGVLDKLMVACADELDQKKYEDTMGFKASGDNILMYSKGTDGGSCSDTADRLNYMLKEYRRRGTQNQGEFGDISCDTGNRFYFGTATACDEEVNELNEMIER